MATGAAWGHEEGNIVHAMKMLTGAPSKLAIGRCLLFRGMASAESPQAATAAKAHCQGGLSECAWLRRTDATA